MKRKNHIASITVDAVNHKTKLINFIVAGANKGKTSFIKQLFNILTVSNFTNHLPSNKLTTVKYTDENRVRAVTAMVIEDKVTHDIYLAGTPTIVDDFHEAAIINYTEKLKELGTEINNSDINYIKRILDLIIIYSNNILLLDLTDSLSIPKPDTFYKTIIKVAIEYNCQLFITYQLKNHSNNTSTISTITEFLLYGKQVPGIINLY